MPLIRAGPQGLRLFKGDINMHIHGWISMALGAALASSLALAAQPGAAPVAPRAAAAPAAPPAALPAAPPAAEAPKGASAEILLTTPPDADNIAAGKITFEPNAFPIMADAKETDIQRLLGQTRPVICRTCRGTGKMTRKAALGQRLDGKALRTITNTYEETCPDCRCEALKCPTTCPDLAKGNHTSCESCGGRGSGCGILAFLRHCCGHCCLARAPHHYPSCPGYCCGYPGFEPACAQCQFCNGLSNLRLAHSRTNACDICRSGATCGKLRVGHGTLVKPDQVAGLLELVKAVGHFKRGGDRWPALRQAVTGRLNSIIETHADRVIDAQWNQSRIQPPTGQPALALGTAQPLPAAPGLLRYGRLDDAQGALLAILVSTDSAETLPSGRTLAGGLVIGRWRADAAVGDKAQEVPVLLVSVSVPMVAAP
jgi:hypothetical protein